jgi:hypothetical protein
MTVADGESCQLIERQVADDPDGLPRLDAANTIDVICGKPLHQGAPGIVAGEG